MPPPVPPAPIASAGIPSESGRLASVEPTRVSVAIPRCRSTERRLRNIGESGARVAAGRLPIRASSRARACPAPACLPPASPPPACPAPARPAAWRALLASITLRTMLRTVASVVSNCSGDTERMSRSALASSGIEFTDVPPLIKPQCTVVRGVDGNSSLDMAASTSLSAKIGLGIAASAHECPPGPLTEMRSRRLPSARSTTAAFPPPSSAIAAPILCEPRLPSPAKTRLIPLRSPAPSSPTLAANRIGQGGERFAYCIAAASASSAVRPAALSQAPGARIREPSSRGMQSVPAGKTVSRCADSKTRGSSFVASCAGRRPSALPS